MRSSISTASCTRQGSCGASDGGRRRTGRPTRAVGLVGIDTTPGPGSGSAPYRIIAGHRGQLRVRPHELLRPDHVGRRPALDLGAQLEPAPRPGPTAAGPPAVGATSACVVRARFFQSDVSILAVGRPEGTAAGRPRLRRPTCSLPQRRRPSAGQGRGEPVRGTGAAGIEPVTRWRRACRRRGRPRRSRGRGRRRCRQPDGERGGAPGAVRSRPPRRRVGEREGRRRALGGDRRGRRRRSRSRSTTRPTAAARSTTCGPGRNGGGTAQLRTELLTASRSARLRLRVSDGFRETTTTSAPFVVARAASAGEGPRARRRPARRRRGRRCGCAGRRPTRAAGGSRAGASSGERAAGPRSREVRRQRAARGTRRVSLDGDGPGRARRDGLGRGCACARRHRSSSASGAPTAPLGPRGRAGRVRDAAGDAAGRRSPPSRRARGSAHPRPGRTCSQPSACG